MSNETAVTTRTSEADKIERVLIGGDIAQLKPEERVSYYRMVCESVGLNPLTKPFAYITLNGKLTLYALKDCTDQLRTINNISVVITAREVVDDCFIVTTQASTPSGRTDGSIGAVSIAGLKGEAKCNAMMKAETNAKRRVTLSICGLGILDETEIESIPSAKPPVAVTTEPIPIRKPAPVVIEHNTNINDHRYDEPVEKPIPDSDPPPTAAQAFDDAAAKGADAAADGVTYINLNKQRYLHRSFREALPESVQPHADKLLGDWLNSKGLVKDGKPSTKIIEEGLFEEFVAEALAFARGLK